MPESQPDQSELNGQSGSPALWLLLGCTAVGKSDVAAILGERLGAEILCVDSMQVYRRMDIGTAKPTPAMQHLVRHHLLDVAEPSEPFTAARFVELADRAIADIHTRGRHVLAVAGTPFYLMALMYGLFSGPSADPEFRKALRQRAAQAGTPALHADLAAIDPQAAARIHPNDMHRIERALEVHHRTGQPISALQRQWDGPARYAARGVGLRRSREDLNHRINARVRIMAQQGLIEEVRSLLARPQGMSEQARAALGYAEIISHLEGQLPLDDAVEQIKINTRRFAKSQRTWFRRFRDVTWLDIAPDETPEMTADRAGTPLTA